MNKRRNMHWQEAGVTKQHNTFSVGIKKSVPGECALFLVCAFFFFLSACSMIESVFEWQVFTVGSGVRIVFSTLIVCVLMECSTLLKPKAAKWLRIGLAPGGCLLFVLFLLVTGRLATISEGFSNISLAYGNYWKEYNGMDYTLYDGVNPVTEAAVLFFITLLCFLFVWLARLLGKTWILSLVPAGVFVAALLVGMSPDGVGLWLLAIGLLLSGAGAYKKAEFQPGESKKKGFLQFVPWLPSAVIVILLCVIVSVFGRKTATHTVLDGRQKMNATIEKIANWPGWDKFQVGRNVEELIRKLLDNFDVDEVQVTGHSERSQLDNTTPKFIGQTVLSLMFDKEPKDTLYLQEYYLDTYRDGEWFTDVSAFEKACKDAGFYPSSVSQNLAQLARKTMGTVAKAEPDADNSWLDWDFCGWLDYTSAVPDRVFLPYFSSVTTDPGMASIVNPREIYIDGHVRYQKNRNLQNLPIDLWDYDRADLMNLTHAMECKTVLTREPWEVWYESYLLKNYLTVPSGMEQVKKAAEEADKQNLTFMVIEGMDPVNVERLNTAYKVAHWLSKNAQYSLKPPELPGNADPVEFFLGTSRQGYCMHFTSAAALMLRSLGVPARYGSGYMAGTLREISNIADPEDKSYITDVVDSDAHAWVEVYLNGIGWIPVEVTSGNVETIDRCTVYTKDGNGEWTIEYVPVDAFGSSQNTPELPGQQTITPVPNMPENPQEETVPPEDTEVSDEKEKEPEAPDKEKKENKTSFGTVAAYVCGVVGLAALAVAIFLWMRKKDLSGQAAEERRFIKKTRRYGNRRRIKYLNQRLYRKLRRKRVLKRKPVWDAEYGKVLKEYCSGVSEAEVDRFMYLVKAAMFSYGEFSDEEVAFCKAFCHKVMYEEV